MAAPRRTRPKRTLSPSASLPNAKVKRIEVEGKAEKAAPPKKQSGVLHFNQLQTNLWKGDRSVYSPNQNIRFFERQLFNPTKEMDTDNESSFSARITWPTINGPRDFFAVMLVDKINADLCSFSFFEMNQTQELKHFLQLRINTRRIPTLFEEIRTGAHATVWTNTDCDDISHFFRQFFYEREKKSLKNARKFSTEGFTKSLEEHRTKGIVQRMKFLIESSKKIKNSHVFYVDWKSLRGNTSTIKIQLNHEPYATNELTESEVLKLHYPEKNMVEGSSYYWYLTAFEKTTQRKEVKILVLMFALDMLVGNIPKVDSGSNMSGTDILNLYKHLNRFLQIKTTYLYDDAIPKSGAPLRVTLSIAKGRTWYMSALGFKLLHGTFGSELNRRPWPQDQKKYDSAVETLQKFPLSELQKLCEETDKIVKLAELQKLSEKTDKKAQPEKQKTKEDEKKVTMVYAFQHLTTHFAEQKMTMTTLKELVNAVLGQSKMLWGDYFNELLGVLLRYPDHAGVSPFFVALRDLYGARLYVREHTEEKETQSRSISPSISP